MKRTLLFSLLLVFLVAVFAFCALQVNAEEETSGTWGYNLTWSYNPQTATLTIEGTGEMGYYAVDAYPWSEYAKEVKHIVLPEGLLNIGEGAFRNFLVLEDVNIPSTVAEIEAYAFEKCASLKKLTFKSGLLGIRMEAFSGCSSLEQVNIPDTVTTIDSRAFYFCTSLKEICLPRVLESNLSDVFENCTSLEKLYIRDSYHVKSYVYGGCEDLKEIGIDKVYFFEQTVKEIPCLLTERINSVTFNGSRYYEYSLADIENVISHTSLLTEKDEYFHWAQCNDCGYDFGKEEHKFTITEVLEEPTTESFGTMRYTCEVCGRTKNKAIDKLPSENSTEDDIGTFLVNTQITVLTTIICSAMLAEAANAILMVVIIRAVIKKHRNNEKTSE